MRKILSLFLAVIMVVVMLPTAALADELELFATDEQPVAAAPIEEEEKEPEQAEEPALQVAAASGDVAAVSSGEKSIGVEGLFTITYEAKSEGKIEVVGTAQNPQKAEQNGKAYVITLPKGTTINSLTKENSTSTLQTYCLKVQNPNLPTEDKYFKNDQFISGNALYKTFIYKSTTFNEGYALPSVGVKGFGMRIMNSTDKTYDIVYVQIEYGIAVNYYTIGNTTVVAEKVGEAEGKDLYAITLPYGAKKVSVDGMGMYLCRTGIEAAMPDVSNWLVGAEAADYAELFGTSYENLYSVVCISNDGSEYLLIQIPTFDPDDKAGPNPFDQEGTESDPYIIETAEHINWINKANQQGETFKNIYFKFADDIESITLPDEWTPIGKTTGFSGTIDGNNKLLIVPKDSLSLIGKPKGCTIKNLNIYGEKIPGYGLIEGYEVSCSAKVDNVTIKSGSHILKSGIVGGYGNTSVNISNCTVEQGVVIGDDDTWGDLGTAEYNYTFVGTVNNQDMIGSFCGAWNGTISNCVSYATVYGRNYVGGIVGFKGQSMRACVISDCAFYGDIIATGVGVGGIVGSGYYAASAPATLCVTIENCYATGSITGASKVGGIFGGELGASNCWSNGIGRIRNNFFCGTVTATDEDGVAGGVIGYMKSIDMYNDIQNNYFVDGCGAENGIGATNLVYNEETVNYSNYLNYGRDDDVMNSDSVTKKITKKQLTNGELVALLNAGKFGRSDWKQGSEHPIFGNEKHIVYIVSQNQYDFYVQNPLEVDRTISSEDVNYESFANMDLLVKYSDGTSETVKASEGVFSGVDFTKLNKFQLASVTYGGYELTFGVKVYRPSTGKIKISIQVLGDSVHGEDGTVHTLAAGNLTEWYSINDYEFYDSNSLYRVLISTLVQSGPKMTFTESKEHYNVARSNYIDAISYNGVTLSSGCNGENSRWNYTINGVNSSVCPAEQYLSDGDVIVLYFTDDMSKELPMGNYDEIQNVKAIIDAIGEVELNSACQSRINAARKAYDKLEEGSKYYVDNYQKLLDAESEYFDLVHADDEPIHIVIGAATNAAAKGEENPNTGAEVI